MTSDGRADSPLTIDGKRCDDSAFPHVWSRCIGAGRANEALRADWQRQFADVVEACGVQYIRFHGVFHDDMFVYRESYGGGFGPDAPLPSRCTRSATWTRCSTSSWTAVSVRSSSWGSCRASWRR
ncbi:hypothetical protein GCM10027612_42410 [Microbispora bryophytorum subsp. camponoti]